MVVGMDRAAVGGNEIPRVRIRDLFHRIAPRLPIRRVLFQVRNGVNPGIGLGILIP